MVEHETAKKKRRAQNEVDFEFLQVKRNGLPSDAWYLDVPGQAYP